MYTHFYCHGPDCSDSSEKLFIPVINVRVHGRRDVPHKLQASNILHFENVRHVFFKMTVH